MALGGLLVMRLGSFTSLLIGGLLQAATNLLFAVQAYLGHDLGMLYIAIGADNFTGGIGSAAFVAYLSALCSARFTATQYALLTSFMAFGRTVLSSGAGWFADQVDWVTFFTATAALAVPGLLLLFERAILGKSSAVTGRKEPEDGRLARRSHGNLSRRHYDACCRRHRQRGQHGPRPRCGRLRRHPPGCRAEAGHGLCRNRELSDRRGANDPWLRPAGKAHYPRGRAGVAGRRRERG
jgi:hypothetical protein